MYITHDMNVQYIRMSYRRRKSLQRKHLQKNGRDFP